MDKSENKAIADLLAESLVRQDDLNAKVDRLTNGMSALAKNVETLADAMMDFKEIVASQSRSMETLTMLMQEQRDDIRDIRYQMNKDEEVKKVVNHLQERLVAVEKRLEKFPE